MLKTSSKSLCRLPPKNKNETCVYKYTYCFVKWLYTSNLKCSKIWRFCLTCQETKEKPDYLNSYNKPDNVEVKVIVYKIFYSSYKW